MSVRGLLCATPRDFNYPTHGGRQSAFSKIWLGKSFMPAQQLVADIAGEYDPETGRPRWPLVVVTGPRQIGKSLLSLARTAERSFSATQPFKSWYTAQTGLAASQQFMKFVTETMKDTPLSHVTKLYRGAGNQSLTFPNSSVLRPYPPTEKGMHGEQADEVNIDEAWAFSREHGQILLQGAAPTQLTRSGGAQVLIWSAGGTAESTWLSDLVAAGRQGSSEFAFIELGVPEHVDILDVDAVYEHHPAAGYTVTKESLRAMRVLMTNDDDWARAAGNRWTEIITGAISVREFEKALTPLEIPPAAKVGFGVAVSLDQSETIIAAAGRLESGVVVCEVVERLPGAFGHADRIRATCAAGPLLAVGEGPSRPLSDALALLPHRPGFDVVAGANYASATGSILAALAADSVLFRDPLGLLSAAIESSATRPVQDGGRVWARKSSGGSIAPLEAVTAAYRALDHAPRRAAKVVVRG